MKSPLFQKAQFQKVEPNSPVCLFGGEIGWMENFREKMGRKTFLSVFGWVGRKENKGWSLGVFSSGPPRSFLSKIERKLKGKMGLLNGQKCPCPDHFFFFFSFFLLFIYLYFFLMGCECDSRFFFFFFFN